MRYISTRGSAPVLRFDGVVLAGLASDGGLYVPESVPSVSFATLREWAKLSYQELAFEVMNPFVMPDMDGRTLKRLINDAYSEFRHPEVTPFVELAPDHYVLELFHGPTLAFKDVALQFLGRLLDHLLEKKQKRALVLGATSGDTGSAAIAGCMHSPRMDIAILYPNGRVSEVQRRQMTTIPNQNVHALALDGTFDDCQAIVKQLFGDAAFRSEIDLVAVNSINWARILAQVVYYFYAALKIGAPHKRISFSVPTGNFGDIFAGYIAQRMGLPISRLIIASNRNDILTRALDTGVYGMHGVHPTLSPSMDIEVSSNFERLLFDLYGRDARALSALMEGFRKHRSLTLSPVAHSIFRQLFSAYSASDEETLATISQAHNLHGMLLDPHTAVGVAASTALMPHVPLPIVTLATAHPAKFPDAVEQATGVRPPLPTHLADLMTRKERITPIANDVEKVKAFLRGLT